MMQAARFVRRVSSSGIVKQQSNIILVRSFSCSIGRRETYKIEDEEDFQKRVIQNPDPVVVDFKANWCGPCKMLTPRLDSAIAATEGKVHLAIVDIDELSDLAMEGGVEAVPTVMAYKGGQVVDKFVGLVDEDRLESFIKNLHSG